MQKSLLENLNNYKEQGFVSFHMPGHKGKIPLECNDIFSIDYTEVPETDSLFENEGILKESELYASKVLKNLQTVYSTGGCTLCIQAMIYMALQKYNKCNNTVKSKKMIIGRTIHASAINTIALLDLQPVYVMPQNVALKGEFPQYAITPEAVKEAVENNQDAIAVYITCPDYYGTLADIKEIANVCHSYNIPLLVDNAHGAHFSLVSTNNHPINLGADLVASSAHKTLPVLTGGAYLEINNSDFLNMAKDSMRLFGSTSPSYPIMVSLDNCFHWIEKEGKELYLQLEQRVKTIKEYISSLGFVLLKGDSCRITLGTQKFYKNDKTYCTGLDLFDHLREDKIQPEYADDSFVVLICTPFNSEEDFIKLEKSLKRFKEKYTIDEHFEFGDSAEFNFALEKLPEQKMLPREALFSQYEEVNIDNSLGRIAYSSACPCPPGVPIVMAGEIITRNTIKFLKKYRFFTIKVVK